MKRTMCEEHTVRNNGGYQYGNHLDSASLELSTAASIISYEEYFPYGDTSFIAGTNQKEVKLKEYRYTGKEKDDVTGLYYYGARYYASWLGRWMSADPLFRENPSVYEKPKGGNEEEKKRQEEEFRRKLYSQGMNLYGYVKGNPVRYVDLRGLAWFDKISKSEAESGKYIKVDFEKPSDPKENKVVKFFKEITGSNKISMYTDNPAKDMIKIKFDGKTKYNIGNDSGYFAIKWVNPAKLFNKPTTVDDAVITPNTGHATHERGNILHAGLDIISKKTGSSGIDKTNLNPMGAGMVTYVDSVGLDKKGNKTDPGKYVVITYGDGRSSRYLHLDETNIKIGQWVNVTDIVGKVGNTGASEGSHLHLEFRVGEKDKPMPADPWQNKWIDPNDVLKNKYQQPQKLGG